MLLVLTCCFILDKAEASLSTQDKYNTLVSIGMDKEVAKSLIKECKATARNPVLCIKIGASILGAESSLGTRCTVDFNCFGMEDGATKYKSKSD